MRLCSRGEQWGSSHKNRIKEELIDWEGVDKLFDRWGKSNRKHQGKGWLGLLKLVAECRLRWSIINQAIVVYKESTYVFKVKTIMGVESWGLVEKRV